MLRVAILLAAATVWESTAPQQWPEAQLREIFVHSPWAQVTSSVQMYLATAQPIREAEKELRRRTKPEEDLIYEDYRAWVEENAATHIVVAVQPPRTELLADAAESRTIERESKLIVAGKRHPVKVMFTPSKTDPWLRLAFPRAVRDSDKEFEIEVYLPGVSGNYRNALFAVKDLGWKGKPEY